MSITAPIPAAGQVTVQSDRLAFDGPLSVAAAIVLGCLLLGLIAWSLRRERIATGHRVAWLFWVLRGVAIGVALWMLLAPSKVRIEQSTTRKSVALVVDTSPSMRTVDPPDTADDYRWAMVADSSRPSTRIALADRALAAATLAAERLENAVAIVRDQGPERSALELAAAAHRSIERVRIHLPDIAADLQPPPSPPSERAVADNPVQRIGEIEQTLGGSEFATLADLAAAVEGGQDAFQARWQESLVDIEHQTQSVRRRLAELVAALARGSVESLSQAEAEPAMVLETQQASRLERVARFIEAVEGPLVEPLREEVDFRHVLFDADSTPLSGQESLHSQLGRLTADSADLVSDDSPPADGEPPVTDIAGVLENLRQMHREQPLAAVFLLTDAAHNRAEGRDPVQVAAEFSDTPVYVVPIGNTRRLRDVELKSITAPSVVMKDDEIVIDAMLEAYDCEGERLRLELIGDGEVIQHRELQVDSATAVLRASFNTQLTEYGIQRCQIRIVPVHGELSEANNFDLFAVNVTRNEIRVLLADSLPRWEYRYLAQLFRRDAKIQCDELLFHPRLIATGERAASQSFPNTVDEWAHYDVVLLGDVSADQLPPAAQESMVEYVRERGGTLVMIAGEESMPHRFEDQPLQKILPVTRVPNTREGDPHLAQPPEGYALEITEAGWRHHALMITDEESSTRTAWDFINRNVPVGWLSSYRQAKPTAQTLISAAPRSPTGASAEPASDALLSWQPVGRGRAVFLASPETFRLRFLRGDRLHYRFWGQLLRWAIASDMATGSERVRIRTDRPDYRNGDSVQVVVRLNDATGAPLAGAAVEAVAVAADDTPVTIPLAADGADPGRYLGTFERLPSGVYRVEAAGESVEALLSSSSSPDASSPPSAHFAIRSPLNRELLNTRSDPALAGRIAEATGGQVLPPTAVAEILALTDLAPVVTETTERRSLWVQWKYLWIVFGCLCSEWIVRKRMGLS